MLGLAVFVPLKGTTLLTSAHANSPIKGRSWESLLWIYNARNACIYYFTDESYSGIISSVNPPTPNEIRKARKKTGLTQTEAAEKVWMSLRAWQDWESGKRTMLPVVFWAFQQRTKHLRSGKD